MGDDVPKFTPEEATLIHYFATERNESNRLWFYTSVLAAPIGIAVYGVFQRDWLALAVGFFGLLTIVVWYISVERRYGKHYRAICEKLSQSGMVSSEGKRDA
jgi:hypothetical protein